MFTSIYDDDDDGDDEDDDDDDDDDDHDHDDIYIYSRYPPTHMTKKSSGFLINLLCIGG